MAVPLLRSAATFQDGRFPCPRRVNGLQLPIYQQVYPRPFNREDGFPQSLRQLLPPSCRKRSGYIQTLHVERPGLLPRHNCHGGSLVRVVAQFAERQRRLHSPHLLLSLLPAFILQQFRYCCHRHQNFSAKVLLFSHPHKCFPQFFTSKCNLNPFIQENSKKLLVISSLIRTFATKYSIDYAEEERRNAH